MGILQSDPVQILYEYLTASGTTLYSAVGTRVWCPIAPREWGNGSTGIVFSQSTGTPEWQDEAESSVFVFKCYGGTGKFEDSRTLARKLHARLHLAKFQRMTSGWLVWAERIVQSQSYEEETGWPVTLSQYQVVTKGEVT